MSDASPDDRVERLRSRREPPPLVPVTVVERVEVTPRLLRLTFEAAGIDAMCAEPAASVRLLVPSPGTTELILPTWNGNEFLLPGDVRPALRTFTPLAAGAPDRLALEIVRHAGGVVSQWAEHAAVGSPAALSGPGRGAEFSPDATTFHLLGDETAVPAIAQLLDRLAPTTTITVTAEVDRDEAIRPLPPHPGATVEWVVRQQGEAPGARLVAAASELAEITGTTHVWAAGEAASMQAIRKLLFDRRGVARSQTTIRGYWKPERTADQD
ncbi:MAG: siderophore-interacting protein [Acidimicrobiales bacterium]